MAREIRGRACASRTAPPARARARRGGPERAATPARRARAASPSTAWEACGSPMRNPPGRDAAPPSPRRARRARVIPPAQVAARLIALSSCLVAWPAAFYAREGLTGHHRGSIVTIRGVDRVRVGGQRMNKPSAAWLVFLLPIVVAAAEVTLRGGGKVRGVIVE